MQKYDFMRNTKILSRDRGPDRNDTKQNIIKYETEYIIFLRVQAASLNKLGIKFRDVDDQGEIFLSTFRSSDIEMSLF